MTAVIVTLLTLIEGLLPEFGSSASVAVIDKILAALIQIVPLLIQGASDFVAPVRNIITALQSTGSATPEQLATIDVLNAKLDAAFEAVMAADGVPADVAPPPAPAPTPASAPASGPSPDPLGPDPMNPDNSANGGGGA